ncbi:MAG: insulinase family protein, partial [Flavobacteriales bacterium]
MTIALTATPNHTTAHPAFELLRSVPIAALSAELHEFRHRVTGASHYHLAADNDENVFLVAFRTQPMDSRGVAHILEHTALCGSARFPVRDPFFSMIRRSLNTFMNAFTAADWTAYPFASQNRTDYFNLLSVYLDAAFFPRLHALDFAQEGIRVELENEQPVFKGIVFNEMKGAMSSPTDQLYHCLSHHLYPQTTYHYNSGGDPACIPDLVHQDLLDFHASHYHPSNAVLMTYGNLPAYALQEQFEQQALSQFEMGERRHSVPEQRLSAPIQVTDVYAI